MTDETLFAAALEKHSPAERSAFLDEACADDPAMRQRVEALLHAHDKAGDFLERPAVAQIAGGAASAAGRHYGLDSRRAGPNRLPAPTEPGDERRGRPARLPAAVHQARLARPAGALRSAGSARPRRLRHRPQGVRRDAAPRRRRQGHGPATGRHVPGPQTLPARGPRLRRRPPRERRRHLRRRGAADPLSGHGVHRRGNPPAEARPDRPAGRRGGGAHRPADRRGAGGGPRAGADPPRRQAEPTSCWRAASTASRSPTSAWPARPTTPA